MPLKIKSLAVQVAAAVGLGRIGDQKVANDLLAVSNPPSIDPLPCMDPVPEGNNEEGEVQQSPVIEGKKVHEFDVDVAGWKELHLTLGDAGNGNGSDHGSWFDPVLLKKDGSIIRLTELKWAKASQGWGKTRVGFSPTGAKLARKDGKAMTDGIGTHSIGSIIYKKLPADIVRFKCTSGLASTDHGGKVRFYVSNQPVTKFAGKGKQEIKEGPHAIPNSAVVLPHVARKALVELGAGDACIQAIDTKIRRVH
jgi:hypothetical protein